MPIPVAEWIVRIALAYAGLGAAFALAFVTVGVGRVDALARGAGVGFRLAILPGVVALWPLLLVRWLRGGGQPEERNAHRAAARGAGGARVKGARA
jgi:hypothetical protein